MADDPFEAAVDAVIAAALAQPMPLAAYAVPDWPEDDPRWQVLDVQPGWWQIDYGETVLREVKRRLLQMRGDALRALLEEGRITRPQLASALGVRMLELEQALAGVTQS